MGFRTVLLAQCWPLHVHVVHAIVRLTAWNKEEDTVFENSDLTTTFRGWQSTGPCGPFEPYMYGYSIQRVYPNV